MNQTTETIVKLIRSALFGQPLPEEWDPGIDWLDVYTETQKQAIVSLFAELVPELPMPEDVRKRWLKQIYAESLKYYAIIGAHRELDEAFNSAGIPYVTLKGIAAAQYYPNPMYRDFGDIDLLISPDKIDAALQMLKSKGFIVEDNDYRRHIELKKGKISLELHRYFSLSEEETASDIWINQHLIDDLVQTDHVWLDEEDGVFQEPVEEGNTVAVPTTLLNGIVLLQHINQHIDTGLGYRQILDFILFASKNLSDRVWSGDEDQDGFCKMAQRIGLEKLAKVTVRMGQLYFGAPKDITWCTDVDDEICHELFEYITNQGNFGRKGSTRSSQVLNQSRGTLFSRLKYEQQSGMTHWQAAKKYKILRPFAWIYGICHHIRKMSELGLWKRLGKDIAASKKQSDFLDRLGVWQRYNRK